MDFDAIKDVLLFVQVQTAPVKGIISLVLIALAAGALVLVSSNPNGKSPLKNIAVVAAG